MELYGSSTRNGSLHGTHCPQSASQSSRRRRAVNSKPEAEAVAKRNQPKPKMNALPRDGHEPKAKRFKHLGKPLDDQKAIHNGSAVTTVLPCTKQELAERKRQQMRIRSAAKHAKQKTKIKLKPKPPTKRCADITLAKLQSLHNGGTNNQEVHSKAVHGRAESNHQGGATVITNSLVCHPLLNSGPPRARIRLWIQRSLQLMVVMDGRRKHLRMSWTAYNQRSIDSSSHCSAAIANYSLVQVEHSDHVQIQQHHAVKRALEQVSNWLAMDQNVSRSSKRRRGGAIVQISTTNVIQTETLTACSMPTHGTHHQNESKQSLIYISSSSTSPSSSPCRLGSSSCAPHSSVPNAVYEDITQASPGARGVTANKKETTATLDQRSVWRRLEQHEIIVIDSSSDEESSDSVEPVLCASVSKSFSKSIPKPAAFDQTSPRCSVVVSDPVLREDPANGGVGTLIVFQPTCLDHHNGTHQENRRRLNVLCGPQGVLHLARFRGLKWANLKELKPAPLSDLLRVHAFEYIQHLAKICAALPEQDPSISVGKLYDDRNKRKKSSTEGYLSPTQYEQRTRGESETTKEPTQHDAGEYAAWLQTSKAAMCYKVRNAPSSGLYDLDSPISRSSFEVARLAAGAVCRAIDKVIHLETRNAFVVVRPPGHHAGPHGCVVAQVFDKQPKTCTSGFCLLNNIAIGAAYAMDRYGQSRYRPPHGPPIPQIDRVAIVDFDIHHGNGTEEIIRNLIPHKQAHPRFTAQAIDSYKPWHAEDDVDNVFFGSIHMYDAENFYPSSGVGPHGCSKELYDRDTIINIPLKRLGPEFLDSRRKLSQTAKKKWMQEASTTFRSKVTTHLLPALRSFGPDLILISAGFDGHADDFYYYLTEDDYGWITQQLVDIAEEWCNGRIVSILEGGYQVDTSQMRTRSGRKKTSLHLAAELHGRQVDQELFRFGSLARSCAAHVSALQQAKAQ